MQEELIIEEQIQEQDQKQNESSNTKRDIIPIIKTSEASYLQAPSVDSRFRIATALLRGGMVPKGYKTPEQVFAGLEYALELGLKPLSGLRNIAVINGQPSTWGELPLALCRRSGLLAQINEYIFDKDFNKICVENKNINVEAFGACCRTLRANETEFKETWFTLDDAKKAGLLSRDNVWKTYPRRMLQMRARSQNLKDNFTDALFGVSIAEYDFNYIPSNNGFIEETINHNGEEIRDVAAEINSDLI